MPIIRGALGGIRRCITGGFGVLGNNADNPNHENAGVNRRFNESAVSMLRWGGGGSRDPQLQQPNALTTMVKIWGKYLLNEKRNEPNIL